MIHIPQSRGDVASVIHTPNISVSVKILEVSKDPGVGNNRKVNFGPQLISAHLLMCVMEVHSSV